MIFKTIEFELTDGNFEIISVFLAHNIMEKKSKNIVFENPDSISVSLHKPICRKRKNPDDIDIYTLGKNNKDLYNFEYCSKKFQFKLFSEKCMVYSSGLRDQPYSTLTIKYEDKESLEEIIKEAKKFYRKFVGDTETEEGKLSVWTNEFNYFTNRNLVPKRDPSTIYLNNKKKQKIIEFFKNFKKKETKENYKKLGIPYKLVVMFHGSPGTGKTSLIHCIASELNMNICCCSRDPDLNDVSFISLLTNVKDNSILVLEDMDFFSNLKEREDKRGVTLGGILNSFDGLSRKNDIIIITMNDIKGLDKAFIRPGRIDMIEEISEAEEEQVRQMYKNFMLTSYTPELEKIFMKEYKKLKFSVTTSLLQQFFFKYIKNPTGLLENIDEIKKIKDKTEPGNENRLYC